MDSKTVRGSILKSLYLKILIDWKTVSVLFSLKYKHRCFSTQFQNSNLQSVPEDPSRQGIHIFLGVQGVLESRPLLVDPGYQKEQYMKIQNLTRLKSRSDFCYYE